MEAGTILYESFFPWLVQTSLRAGLLIVVILLLQRILGNRLGVRGRYCLWLLLLVRLAMPWTPPSRVSLYNLLPTSIATGNDLSVAADASGRTDSASKYVDRDVDARGSVPTVRRGTNPTGNTNPEDSYWPVGWTVRGLSMLWLLGAFILAGYTLASATRLRRIVRDGQRVTSRETLDVLNACKDLIGTKASVDVIATDRLGSPALFGLLRPRLLLPLRTLTEANPSELRYIFLHELAHLKRRDILVGYIASVLHILHWFNPLVALAMHQMRIDREPACDAMALSRLRPEETTAYGRTIVQQIERLLAAPRCPFLLGLSSSGVRTKQRIAMIARFRRDTYRWSPLPLLLLVGLAYAGLTGHVTGDIEWDHYARGHFPTTHQDKHLNISRACIYNTLTNQYLVARGQTVACDADEPGLAGLWEFRFDIASNEPDVPVYFYSVPAQRYLTCDEQGNLGLDATEPSEAACWGTKPGPGGVWMISHNLKNGYLHLDDAGLAEVQVMGRDHTSYWDIHRVWRVKTCDDPSSNPQWQREKMPGPD